MSGRPPRRSSSVVWLVNPSPRSVSADAPPLDTTLGATLVRFVSSLRIVAIAVAREIGMFVGWDRWNWNRSSGSGAPSLCVQIDVTVFSVSPAANVRSPAIANPPFCCG